MFAQLLDITLRFLAETFEQQTAIMFGRQDLRPFGVNLSVAHPDLIDAIHQFGDEIETKLVLPKVAICALGRENHLACSRSRNGNRLLSLRPMDRRVQTRSQDRATQGAPAAASIRDTERQRQTASIVKMASAIQIRQKVMRCARVKCLVVNENAEKECAARRKILEKADSR